ncbi:MAG: hypothetical protein ACJATN_000392 [Neolewinella sp.]
MAAVKTAKDILPREFPGQAETISIITKRLEERRAEIEKME